MCLCECVNVCESIILPYMYMYNNMAMYTEL